MVDVRSKYALGIRGLRGGTASNTRRHHHLKWPPALPQEVSLCSKKSGDSRVSQLQHAHSSGKGSVKMVYNIIIGNKFPVLKIIKITMLVLYKAVKGCEGGGGREGMKMASQISSHLLIRYLEPTLWTGFGPGVFICIVGLFVRREDVDMRFQCCTGLHSFSQSYRERKRANGSLLNDGRTPSDL